MHVCVSRKLVAFRRSFDCEIFLRPIDLKDPIVSVVEVDLEQTSLPDLAAAPQKMFEVFFLPTELKPLALICFTHCNDLTVIISKVDHL